MPKDILLDGNDLAIVGGDFAVGESSAQHQELLLLSNKGEWKENPMRGVGVIRFVETGDKTGLAREIASEFSRDGMKIAKIEINIPDVEIDAEYEY
ncbi:MAG: hypothetical protein LBD53_01060 [Tannerella sp.]|jgi:hypothetical protein|nr:hypothetical protein [Tannerella sp.]